LLFGNIETVFNAVLFVVGLFLARRNLRLGRGDRAGALKVALAFLAVHLVVWLFLAQHFLNFSLEWNTVFRLDTGYSLFLALEIWVLYLALEPFVRRRWPETLISWNRLLRGRIADPSVGRDILIGGAFALLALPLIFMAGNLPDWMSGIPAMPHRPSLQPLHEPLASLVVLVDTPIHAIMFGLRALFLLVVLRGLVRKPWLAIVLFVVIFTPITFWGPWPEMLAGAAVIAVASYLIIRFGLLVVITTKTLADLMFRMILTIDFTAWYAPVTLVTLLAIVATGLWAFYVSLGGRPAFGGGLLEE